MDDSTPSGIPIESDSSVTEGESAAADRLAGEMRHFEGEDAYQPLPPICTYRIRRYVQPRIREVFGGDSQTDFYVRPIKSKAVTRDRVQVLSLGSGNGRLERDIARQLLRAGQSNFLIEGLEYSAANVASANELAAAEGLSWHVRFFQGDFNALTADGSRDIVIANQILHHVSELEILFDAAALMLENGGLFLTRDVIGRNGHRAWPECRELVDRVWAEMPRRYRYSHRQQRFLDAFPDKDYSQKSSEGIRAQDVLPLMLERFSFLRFYAHGGITEKIVNRALGPNYDLANEDDLAFVHMLQVLNDSAIDGGIIKPTQMLAHVSVKPRKLTCWRNRTPEHCLRVPD